MADLRLQLAVGAALASWTVHVDWERFAAKFARLLQIETATGPFGDSFRHNANCPEAELRAASDRLTA